MKVMKYIALVILSSLIVAYSFHDSLIPMEFNNEIIEKPFLGGFNRPKIQWIDWDLDDDLDLFILDSGGYLRYLENKGNSINPDFHLITTFYQEIYVGLLRLLGRSVQILL